MSSPALDSVPARLAALDIQYLRDRYTAQGSFLSVDEFLPSAISAQLIAVVGALEPAVNRNYLPGHKQGGSISRYTIDRLAPAIAQLYRSPALLRWLEQLTGESLQLSPDDDPHPMHCISTPSPAITSAGTTTPPITPDAAIPCYSA